MAEKNNFENQLTELEQIVNQLETGNLPLDEALTEFQKGITLSRDLQTKLTQAQETVARLVKEDGSTQRLDPNNAAAPEEN
ncbi:exodeoxyribonuclease VII small subunit [Lactobacillus sp. PV037]|uniref:exodeoxyribonuclease VII small subunit n=1 Tax=Lactobacillus sp. PV037 TaxID=2594496 RepID=UPI00223F4F36|nr:exodeoxyribonuclease VII small subunit [Lactobacillus sp. PV037]QNQ83885.1 exodeoxyribonuclease VII small subunit [Lactobacillus sp. PV037]